MGRPKGDGRAFRIQIGELRERPAVELQQLRPLEFKAGGLQGFGRYWKTQLGGNGGDAASLPVQIGVSAGFRIDAPAGRNALALPKPLAIRNLVPV